MVRSVSGHWEGDLLAGTSNSHIATLVERHSRFTIPVKVLNKYTATVVAELSRQVRKLPASLRRRLTWDRGLEMPKHTSFTVAIKVNVYFCDLQSPWQCGTLKDPHVRELFGLSRETFVKAGKLLDGPFEEISIPYGTDTLPGYLIMVDDSGKPRPTIIYTNGFDSTTKEGYYVIGAAALRRGFNNLADSPQFLLRIILRSI